ncbi:hypothetical protein EWW49_28360, partial [Pseudomonas syringae]
LVYSGVYCRMNRRLSATLLVLHQLKLYIAMRGICKVSTVHITRILVVELSVSMPLWLLKGACLYLFPEPQSAAVSVITDSIGSLLQLFTTIVTFRLFMLISQPAHRA